MKDSPIVSIVTPSYNQGRFIEELILSVVEQTYPFIEHIIVDGNSTDDTVKTLKEYGACVEWTSEPDEGFSDACNKGFKLSKGTILTIMNADDVYSSNKSIERAVKLFSENPDCRLIFGGVHFIDETGNILQDGTKTGHYEYSFEKLLCSEFTISQGSAFFTREAIEAVGGLDTELEMAEEIDLWLRIASSFPVRHVDEVLSCYRIHDAQKSVRLHREFVKRTRKPTRLPVLDKFFSNALPSSISKLRPKAYGGAYRFEGGKMREIGELQLAQELNRKALEYCPEPKQRRSNRLMRWLKRLL